MGTDLGLSGHLFCNFGRTLVDMESSIPSMLFNGNDDVDVEAFQFT